MQNELELLPVCALYFPLAQFLHALRDVWSVYFPLAHEPHEDLPAPLWKLPFPHGLHDAEVVRFVWSPYLPAEQVLHAERPVSSAYFPFAQSEHAPVPAWPFGHAAQLCLFAAIAQPAADVHADFPDALE